jgi:hypothetical protein
MTELCGKPLVFKSFMSDLSNPSTQQLAVVVCYQVSRGWLDQSVDDRYCWDAFDISGSGV